jgi:hypothetical protein
MGLAYQQPWVTREVVYRHKEDALALTHDAKAHAGATTKPPLGSPELTPPRTRGQTSVGATAAEVEG